MKTEIISTFDKIKIKNNNTTYVYSYATSKMLKKWIADDDVRLKEFITKNCN